MKIALICGGGDLPQIVAEVLQNNRNEIVCVHLKGERPAFLELNPTIRQETIGWGQLGRLFSILESEGISKILAVGSVKKRPDFSSMKLDLKTIVSLPTILTTIIGGDDTVLNNVANYFAKKGYEFLSVLDVAPELAVTKDYLVERNRGKKYTDDIALACKAALAAGKLDLGQGAVAAANRVIAIEGPEGTENMLARVQDIKLQERARWKVGQGVLVKCAKPRQDLRFDLPVIGPATIDQVKAAGLAGIAIESGRVLLLHREEIIARAQKANIFVLGY